MRVLCEGATLIEVEDKLYVFKNKEGNRYCSFPYFTIDEDEMYVKDIGIGDKANIHYKVLPNGNGGTHIALPIKEAQVL